MELEPVRGAIKTIEQQDRPPFVIRAHHLDKFRMLLESEESVNDFEGKDFKLLKEPYPFRSLQEGYDAQSYLNDVLGSTQEQASKYRRYVTEFYEEFLQLPPDYPVKIAQDQKDKICQGCASGEHCSMKPTKISDRDKVYIIAFRETAKKLNLEDGLTVVGEIATYNNAKPEIVESILTTAGTVKKVLLETSFLWAFLIAIKDLPTCDSNHLSEDRVTNTNA